MLKKRKKTELTHTSKSLNVPTSKAFAKQFARNAYRKKLRLNAKSFGELYETNYSKKDQVKSVEDSL